MPKAGLSGSVPDTNLTLAVSLWWIWFLERSRFAYFFSKVASRVSSDPMVIIISLVHDL